MILKKYAIDACALIDAAKNYNMSKKTFSNIWEKLEEMVENGTLITSVEIKDELMDDDIINWCNKHKEMFVKLSVEIQEKVTNVLRDFPNMIKITTKKNSNGDPFLVATALVKEATIVTNEKRGENKIPTICEEIGIECLNLNGFLDEILE